MKHDAAAKALEVLTMVKDWLNSLDEVGQIPLTRAARLGRSEVTNIMLLQEAQDSQTNFRDPSEFHCAACWRFDDIVLDLTEEGADPSDMDAQGEPPPPQSVAHGEPGRCGRAAR